MNFENNISGARLTCTGSRNKSDSHMASCTAPRSPDGRETNEIVLLPWACACAVERDRVRRSVSDRHPGGGDSSITADDASGHAR